MKNNDIEIVVKESIEKGRKTIRQHFYSIVKVLVVLCIFTLTISKVVQYVTDNKIDKITNEIVNKERKLDSIQNQIEISKVIHKELDIKIIESEKKQKLYKTRTDEILKEYYNIRKKVKDFSVDDDFINVSEYLDSIRTDTKEKK